MTGRGRVLIDSFLCLVLTFLPALAWPGHWSIVAGNISYHTLTHLSSFDAVPPPLIDERRIDMFFAWATTNYHRIPIPIKSPSSRKR